VYAQPYAAHLTQNYKQAIGYTKNIPYTAVL